MVYLKMLSVAMSISIQRRMTVKNELEMRKEAAVACQVLSEYLPEKNHEKPQSRLRFEPIIS
jgi:hypothetical protein